MVLQVGMFCAHEGEYSASESRLNRYETLAEENQRKRKVAEKIAEESTQRSQGERSGKEAKQKRPPEFYMGLFKEILKRSVRHTGSILLPTALQSTDPFLQRAERILIDSNVIKKTRRIPKRRSGCLPQIRLAGLARKPQM